MPISPFPLGNIDLFSSLFFFFYYFPMWTFTAQRELSFFFYRRHLLRLDPLLLCRYFFFFPFAVMSLVLAWSYEFFFHVAFSSPGSRPSISVSFSSAPSLFFSFLMYTIFCSSGYRRLVARPVDFFVEILFFIRHFLLEPGAAPFFQRWLANAGSSAEQAIAQIELFLFPPPSPLEGPLPVPLPPSPFRRKRAPFSLVRFLLRRMASDDLVHANTTALHSLPGLPDLLQLQIDLVG